MHADRPRARPRARPARPLAHRRAVLPASSRSAWPRRPAGAVAVTCTSGTAAANLAPAVIEAARGARPADRADRRPAAGAARRRRRADDRPDQALRRRRPLVRRGRQPPGDGRPPALDPRARLPGVLDRARRTARPRPPQLAAARAARARSRAARAAARGPRRRSSVDLHVGRRPAVRRLPRSASTTGPAESSSPDAHAAPASDRRSPSSRPGPDIRCSPIPSPARGRGPAAIAHYDALLRPPGRFEEPDLVIRVGDLPTSKPLRGWLAGLGGDPPDRDRPARRLAGPRRRRRRVAERRPAVALLATSRPGPGPGPAWLERLARSRPACGRTPSASCSPAS